MKVWVPFLVSALLVPSLSAQTKPVATLMGSISEKVYTSANGTFRIPLPVIPEAGGRIYDNQNVATFEDDFKTHLSIAAFPFSREQRWEYETRGTKDYLIYTFTNVVEPDFAQRFPGSRVESARFIPAIVGGALLVFTLHPGGSFFDATAGIGVVPSDPVVAKRGNLCFVRNGIFFIVTTELAERITERSTYKKTVDEENEILRTRLLEVVSKLQFPPPPSLAK